MNTLHITKMPEYVKKRNGVKQRFDAQKLRVSIHMAMHQARRSNRHLENKITEDAILLLKSKTVTSESIRKAVCSALKRDKHHEACDFYSLIWLRSKPVRVRGVIKRSGKRERFSAEKLYNSLQKSFAGAHVHDTQALTAVTKAAIVQLNAKYRGKDITIEELRDFVEFVLIKHGQNAVAKNYIMHRYS